MTDDIRHALFLLNADHEIPQASKQLIRILNMSFCDVHRMDTVRYIHDSDGTNRGVVTDIQFDDAGNLVSFKVNFPSDNDSKLFSSSDIGTTVLVEARDYSKLTSIRQDCLSWDQYFMGIAQLSALRSKDPNTQVGCCIVSNKNKVLSIGYNGMPTGLDESCLPWSRNGDFLNSKYAYVCHAELNAILNNPGYDLSGSILYTTLFPCNECAKAIIQSGIIKVVYLDNKYPDSLSTKAANNLFDLAHIPVVKYVSNTPISFLV